MAGGERAGEDDDEGDDDVDNDDHWNVDYVFDADVERKKLCKWL